jgi:hypothetical protein
MRVDLEKRARRARARAAIKRWEYRQRDLAMGVWFQLRRVLADAREAYAISRADAELLIKDGSHSEPVGARLEPPKVFIFVTPERLATIASRRSIPVRLGRELLDADALALVRFGVQE